MARAQSYLWGAGGTLILVSLLLTRAPGTNVAGMVGIGVLALCVATLLWGGQGWLPSVLFSPAVALGSLVISLLMWFDGSTSSVFSLFYVWPALYAFYFFGRSESAVHGVTIAVLAGIEMTLREPAQPPAGRWLVIVGTVIVAGVWAQYLVQSLRETEANLRDLTLDLEHRVGERTAELQASNEELEAFSYTVAHDLRAPVRAIAGFSRILHEEGEDLSPEDSRRYLDKVRKNAVDMGNLIDGLLAFSRLSRQAFDKETLDPAEVARTAADRVVAGLGGRAVDIRVDEMPACQSNRILLDQVFTNLLGNAVKFSRDRPVARVEVGSIRGDSAEAPVYFVRDYGVGFDMKHADQLFGVFQRLHGAGDFEGSGAGLAIVQRIIQRHGGRAWAEAEPGVGATFYFTLG